MGKGEQILRSVCEASLESAKVTTIVATSVDCWDHNWLKKSVSENFVVWEKLKSKKNVWPCFWRSKEC